MREIALAYKGGEHLVMAVEGRLVLARDIAVKKKRWQEIDATLGRERYGNVRFEGVAEGDLTANLDGLLDVSGRKRQGGAEPQYAAPITVRVRVLWNRSTLAPIAA